MTDLDPTTFPEFRERIAAFEAAGAAPETPRSYPGYPRVELPASRARRLVSLDRTLEARRTPLALGTTFPTAKALGHLLRFAHGALGPGGRGPVPSAGNLQALELFLVRFAVAGEASRWLEPGAWHYDRAGHHLSRISVVGGPEAGAPEAWWPRVPSLDALPGGAALLVVVGDGARVARKYGERGERFLALEAGHLVQNLALLATSLGLGLVPLGGFFERETARALALLRTDLVLYAAALGTPLPRRD